MIRLRPFTPRDMMSYRCHAAFLHFQMSCIFLSLSMHHVHAAILHASYGYDMMLYAILERVTRRHFITPLRDYFYYAPPLFFFFLLLRAR